MRRFLWLVVALSPPTVFSAKNIDCDFAAFALINTTQSGIMVKSVKNWYTKGDVESIKKAYPVPPTQKVNKITIYRSDSAERTSLANVFPERLAFYENQSVLREIAKKMRNEIIQSLPTAEQEVWKTKRWSVSVQFSTGNKQIEADATQHVHRDSIVASLALEGVGTVAKISKESISRLTPQTIYKTADGLPGHSYQAAEGNLLIINAVHFPDGGLHAAPSVDGNYPSRLSVFVSIIK